MNPMLPLLIVLAVLPGNLSLAAESDEPGSAGPFTVPVADAQAFSQPAPALSERQREAFRRGQAEFNRSWVVFSFGPGGWGLGPTFVADRCSACHLGGGRGNLPRSRHAQLTSMVVRVSVPGAGPHGGPQPLGHYGEQLQNRALQGQQPGMAFAYAPVPAEADVYVAWEEHVVALADGSQVSLRRPIPSIENPSFGELPAGTMTSLRIAPPVFGLGLLEAVPAESILEIARTQRERGFNGRPNIAWDALGQRMTLGRFGWKAAQPGLRQQVAAAALHDMGLTSSLFPRQNCPEVQTVCRREVPGNDPELIDAALAELETAMLGTAAPAPRNQDDPDVRRGAALFEQLQCAVCHVPALRTADYFARLPQLSRRTFRAYTDLLLHDMGEGLADHRPDFAAGGRDWRTPPLWGLGLSKTVSGSSVLLHDGRARDVTEAILWHGGEAQGARDAFARLSKDERDALIAFLHAI
ncbi:MAG: c-type cytochrome [Burkholderiales bacterium]|nr:c-type cytochrome [Burkholderiales bacterium]